MQLILFVGIQASGKSTFYKRRFVDTHLRLDLDMLRTRHRERLLFEACLEAKQPVIIDNMNLTRAERARYTVSAKAHRFELVGYHFLSPVEDALARNAIREGRRRIPERGIRGAARQLEPPTHAEGFGHLWTVRIDPTEPDGFAVEELLDERNA